MSPSPRLTRRTSGSLAWWTDEDLILDGVLVVFSERTGGTSRGPYSSLNLGAHVGDVSADVDANRMKLLEAVGIGESVDRLTLAEQVHGSDVAIVEIGGAGSRAGTKPVTGADALVTSQPSTPLLLCFADCLPMILVAPGPAVAVVHAGWRGTLAGVVAKTVDALAQNARCSAADIKVYIGPHIGPCHYKVSADLMSQFENVFGTVARADSGGLDLGSIANANLIDAGVQSCHIASLGSCTAEETDRFFSYRAEAGLTGRHGALACIVS